MEAMQETNHTVVRIQADQPRIWTIHSLAPDSTLQVSLRAHNRIGLSEESSVTVTTPAGTPPPHIQVVLRELSKSIS